MIKRIKVKRIVDIEMVKIGVLGFVILVRNSEIKYWR